MLHQKIVTILSTKGGVGKTTLTANLGGYLSSLGFRVLMVDADFQPALSSYYKINDQALQGLTAFYGGACKVGDCVSKTPFGDLVVSDDPAGSLQSQVMALADGRVRLKQRLVSVRDVYDFILVDTQGAAGPLQEAAALAGDLVLSPLPVSALVVQEWWRGTLALMAGLKGFEAYGLVVPPVKAVLWMVDNTNDSVEISKAVREMALESEEGFCVLDAVVHKRVAWRVSATSQLPVCNLGRKGEKATAELRSIVCELWPELEVQS